MQVVAYLPSYSAKQRDILHALAAGIPDATTKPLEAFVPGEADVAVVFGWYKHAYAPTMAKRPIIDYSGHRLLVIESAFQHRPQYYQVGWGGFAGHADFRNENVPGDRWRKLGIEVLPWRVRSALSDLSPRVVVIGQLPRDTQVQDVDHPAWCRRTVAWYQREGGYDVRFRPHPRIDDLKVYGINGALHDTRPLAECLADASQVVTWNSTTGVDAIIAGVPVVACDRGSVAWPMASHELYEEPRRLVRDRWLAGLGYAQWTLDEMREGLTWQHLSS